MGVVYRARDLKLDRWVALKFLPPELSHTPEEKERFIREARAASALDHPNVCTIYEIEETDEGQLYIVMAYYEGETLRERLARGPLGVAEALDIAIQVARGLGRAHEAGIVHRDVKPGNIMVTRRGEVKVIDFGLAKLAGGTRLTRTGTVLGTVAYMSPEQARGEEVDARSDVWALGAVLYEMVAGRAPFGGETVQGTIYRILNQEPEPLERARPGVPEVLAAVVTKALRKKAEERYGDMATMLGDLEQIRAAMSSGATESLVAITARDVLGRRVRWWVPVGLGLVVVAVAAGAVYMARRGARGPGLREPLRIVTLTGYPGNEFWPELAPDGTRLAFTWTGGQKMTPSQLYVMTLRDRRVRKLTNFEKSEQGVWMPAWSPDGQRIAFLRNLTKRVDPCCRYEVDVVPSQGGSVVKLTTVKTNGFAGLSWSPDGRYLAMTDRIPLDAEEHTEGIVLLDLETGERRVFSQMPEGTKVVDYRPRFSPDGGRIAFFRYYPEEEGYREEVVVQPLTTGRLRVVTPAAVLGPVQAHDFDWTPDGRALLVVVHDQEDDHHIWAFPLDGGEPFLALSVGQWITEGLSVARNGSGLAYVKSNEDVNIWRMPGPEAEESGPPERFIATSERDQDLQLSPDGRHIAYVTEISGKVGIWVCNAEGQNCYQLPTRTRSWGYNWSPDSRQIVYVERDLGNGDIYVIGIDEAFPRPLVEHEAGDYAPVWSPDGQWIYFTSRRTGQNEIWRVPAAGGGPELIKREVGEKEDSESFVSALGFSRDGKYVYYIQWSDQSLWRVPRDGGRSERVVAPLAAPVTGWFYSMWQGQVAMTVFTPDRVEFRLLDPDSGKVTTLAQMEWLGLPTAFSISPDGQWMYFEKEEGTGRDILYVRNFAQLLKAW